MEQNKFVDSLNEYSEKDWFAAVGELVPAIHAVDRNAVQIWFRFYPLALHRYLGAAEDKAAEIQKCVIQGDYELKNQIDSSHRFLYGHRYWKSVKEAIEERAMSGNPSDGLVAEIKAAAAAAASKAGADAALTTAIAAVGLMTLNQVELEDFTNASGETSVPRAMNASPDAVLAARAKDDSQGIFGFLKTVDRQYTVSWADANGEGSFRIKNDADIASASALDQSQNWQSKDERCWEGVVPVECRSAACGTCWVGVLGGEEKLSEVQRLERKQMSVFGYNQPDEARPFMRLACQAKAHGNVTIVIPPWNGVFGRKVYGVEESRLEPATTSAKKLRETLAAATGKSGE